MEKRIKKWSQKKKIAFIEGRYNDLIELSKNNFNPNEAPLISSSDFHTFYSDFEKIDCKIENCIENSLEDAFKSKTQLNTSSKSRIVLT